MGRKQGWTKHYFLNPVCKVCFFAIRDPRSAIPRSAIRDPKCRDPRSQRVPRSHDPRSAIPRSAIPNVAIRDPKCCDPRFVPPCGIVALFLNELIPRLLSAFSWDRSSKNQNSNHRNLNMVHKNAKLPLLVSRMLS